MNNLYTFIYFIIFSTSLCYSQHWEEIKNIAPPYNSNYWLDVYFHPSNPDYGWICGFNGMIIRTTDGGENWAGAVIPIINHLEHIHFPTLTTGYTSGPAGIFKSTNGGQNWFDVTPDFNWDYWGCYFVNENVGFVIGGGCNNEQRFYKTTNGGLNWSYFEGNEISSGLTDLIVYEQDGLGYAVSSGKLWRTTNGGSSWEVIASSGSNVWNEEITNIGSSFLLPYAGTTCSGQGGDGGMRFTTDLGVSWLHYQTGFEMFGTFLINTHTGWACGDNESVYYTSDAGHSWVKKNCGINESANLDDIWFINENVGFVVGNGVYKLNNAEYLINKDSLIFDNLCKDESLVDSLLLDNFSFNISEADFEIIDDFGNHFMVVSPNSPVNLQPCTNIQIKVVFSPKDEENHTAKLRIRINPNKSNEYIKIIELVGIIKKSTAFPQDTLIILDNVVCNTIQNATLPWFIQNLDEVITEVDNITKSSNIYLSTGIPFTIKNPVSNVSFHIQLADTGWHKARFRFTTDPCQKDTFVTVRAYGVSPIISHYSKGQINSVCSEPTLDTIRIYNTGNAPLRIGEVSITPFIPDFKIIGWVNNLSPMVIPVGEYNDLIIEYSPTNNEIHVSQISIINNDSTKVNGNKNPYFINLRGVTQNVSLTDSLFIDFGDICLNSPKLQSVRIYNKGNIDATLSYKNIHENITISLNPVNGSIKKNDSLTVTVKLIANKLGDFEEIIEFNSNPCNRKTILVISGNVVSNELEIIPTTITGVVKLGETFTKSVKINSLSNININIKNIRLEPSSSDWTFNFTPMIPMLLLPKQGTEFTFNFTPNTQNALKSKIIIETDGICSETFIIDVDISSLNRMVTVSPAFIDLGTIYCDESDIFREITIKNMGFYNDTISSIKISENQHFLIENPPSLPYVLSADEELKLRIKFSISQEGNYSSLLIIKTIGGDGQQFEIPLKYEFKKSIITPDIHTADFGNMEFCSESKSLILEYQNHGTLQDTLNLMDVETNEIFSIDKDFIVVPANSSTNIEIKVHPDKFEQLGIVNHQWIFRSKICEALFIINAEVDIIESILTVDPKNVDFGTKWSEIDVSKTVTIRNEGLVTVEITDVKLSDDVNFILKNNIVGVILNPNENITLEIDFIGRQQIEYNAEVSILYSSDCNDSINAELKGIVNHERYENLVYIDRYEAVAGDLVELYVKLKDGLDRVKPSRINFEISFDRRLFYPSKTESKYGNGFVDITYTYSKGIIAGFIENEYAEDLLKDSGNILKISGMALASLPDSTILQIDKFEVISDKSLEINKKSGLLKLIDYCEGTLELGQYLMMPRFKINSGNIANSGILQFEITSTSELDINYSIVDISGIVYDNGKITAGTEVMSKNLNIGNLSTGVYFMIFESKYQSEMLRITNLK